MTCPLHTQPIIGSHSLQYRRCLRNQSLYRLLVLRGRPGVCVCVCARMRVRVRVHVLVCVLSRACVFRHASHHTHAANHQNHRFSRFLLPSPQQPHWPRPRSAAPHQPGSRLAALHHRPLPPGLLLLSCFYYASRGNPAYSRSRARVLSR